MVDPETASYVPGVVEDIFDSKTNIHPATSHQTIVVLQWVIYTVLCQTIDVFGTITNIINIVCFIKQGFKDPVNISLLGLAISDIGCLVTLAWINVCVNPAFNSVQWMFDPIELSYLTGGLPHVTFGRITSWITAFITLERCLCITMPLKIGRIITPTRVSIIIVGLFTVLIFCVAPSYVVNRLETRYMASLNKTVLALVHTADSEVVERTSYAINNVFIPFASFAVIIVCTLVLVIKLRRSSKWRKASANTLQADNVTTRNLKVTKMVAMISGLFIVCFTPVSINFIAMTLEPELSIRGRHMHLLIIIMGFGFVLESINSSVNIFIYYHMSSKFRATFRQLFRSDVAKDKHISKCVI